MRVLNAASRRGMEITALQSFACGPDFFVTLPLEANSRQIGQLTREWHSIMDVIEVLGPLQEFAQETPWIAAQPPASAPQSRAQASA